MDVEIYSQHECWVTYILYAYNLNAMDKQAHVLRYIGKSKITDALSLTLSQWPSSGNPVCLELRPKCTLECQWKNNCW